MESKTVDGKLRQWWTAKYGMHTVVPYEKRTRGGLLYEYFLEKALELNELEEQKIDEEFYYNLSLDERSRLDKRIASLQALLLDNPPNDANSDPLVDKWERELAMGLEPDLDEGLG